MKTPVKWYSFIIASFFLSACSSNSSNTLTEKAHSSTTEILENHYLWDDEAEYDDENNNKKLTDLIDLPELIPLIQFAHANNPNLLQDALTAEIQSQRVKSTQNNTQPTLDANVNANKSEGSNLTFNPSVTVRWEADLWQKLALEEKVSVHLYQQNLVSLEAAQDSLSAKIIKNWLQQVYQQRIIDINTQRVDLLEKNSLLVLKQFKSGLGSLEDKNTAQTASEKAKSTLSNDKENLAITKRTLSLYLGLSDSLDMLPERLISKDYPDIISPLSKFGLQDLQGRPDLRSAFINIKINELNTDISYKALLPSFNLQASLSNTDSSLKNALFTSPVWSLLGQLSAPIFQQGQLKTNIKIAELKTAQAYQNYREVLSNALFEVENAISLESSLESRQKHIENALNNSRKSLQQYRKKYRSGLVDLSNLINAQENTFNLEAELEGLLFQRLSNRIDLGLALGLSGATVLGDRL
ncbi:TolC family protein [Marinomonas sp. 15G1-11]|uniref:TolC family protein n=1 Tax=Marinomonas phaeophyticola TaxID=3004091 RepID=A0ABT4JRN0_9GAMM|nr:TolC family protein [Marinomonas sp. 15G1-11]MCZ2720677.1 TolC family protein [Marinomonas sp. 15G1-11]